jgi:hypothetical protein
MEPQALYITKLTWGQGLMHRYLSVIILSHQRSNGEEREKSFTEMMKNRLKPCINLTTRNNRKEGPFEAFSEGFFFRTMI